MKEKGKVRFSRRLNSEQKHENEGVEREGGYQVISSRVYELYRHPRELGERSIAKATGRGGRYARC